ncbi:glutathione S-transferase [Martensiomyces pterosporus]|nr:glutathione S-transferase [Martensiomyces pterosporus]
MGNSNSSPSSSYVLRYFNVQGFAETSRILLTVARADWTEEHPDWPKEKASQPFGHMPVLVQKNANGKVDFVLSESQVIERYIARKFGLLPSDPMQSARQEQLRDQYSDLWKTHVAYCKSTGESRKAAAARYEEDARKIVEVHSRVLRENGNNGHFFGDKLSYIDIAAYAFFKFFRLEGPRALERQLNIFSLENAPEINKLVATVEADPALEPYFAAERETGVRELTLFK